MAEARAKDQIVVAIGQKEKARANSPKIKAKIRLCTTIESTTLSSISIDQRTCKIKGKLTAKTSSPFHKNSSLKAYITLKTKKPDKSVKRKVAVEAARYKGIVRMAATLKTFWERSKR